MTRYIFEYLSLSEKTFFLRSIPYDESVKFDEIRAVRDAYKNSEFDFYFTGELTPDYYIQITAVPFKRVSEYNKKFIIPSFAIVDGKKYPLILGMDSIYRLNRISTIYIPKTISKIIANPFYEDNIEDIECDSQNKFFTSNDGVLYSKDLSRLIACPPILSKNYVFPTSVKIIGTQAFHGALIEKIVLPLTVEKLEIRSLNSHNLKVIFVPSSVKIIEDFAFGDWGEHQFRTIYVCYNTKIGEHAFCKEFFGRKPKERIIMYAPKDEDITLNKVIHKPSNQIHIDWDKFGNKIGTIFDNGGLILRAVGIILLVVCIIVGIDGIKKHKASVSNPNIPTVHPVITNIPTEPSPSPSERRPTDSPSPQPYSEPSPYPTTSLSQPQPSPDNSRWEEMYRSQYAEMERQAERDYNSLTNLGARYINNGNLEGSTGRDDPYIASQISLFKQLQHRMRDLRFEASKHNVSISQSNWESVEVHL